MRSVKFFRGFGALGLPAVLAITLGFGAIALGEEEGMVAIKGGGPDRKYPYLVLTPDQLRVCVDLGSEMVTLKKDIPNLESKLGQEEAELNALKTDLDAKKAKAVSKTDLDEVNKVVETYNNRVNAYKKDVAKFNDSANRHNSAMEEYKKNCAGWKFYQEDFDALTKAGGK
ncbi:MAG: hypothetical protein OEV92_12105 [Nitrospinota bacterium]|nr:hypothetical protein [Nitrospinota bacterium]